MRSIGKIKIRKLNAIIAAECEKAAGGPFGTFSGSARENILERIPGAWYDTWESAWSEIERLVSDGICNYRKNN